jgi:eukaryotic-like serine/threonine-protein kinase
VDSTETASRERRSATHVWRFASFEFDELRLELRVRGVAVEIETKLLDVVYQLLLHAGEVVTKDELLEAVWPGTAVVDGSLATAVSKLRKALGTDQHASSLFPESAID